MLYETIYIVLFFFSCYLSIFPSSPPCFSSPYSFDTIFTSTGTATSSFFDCPSLSVSKQTYLATILNVFLLLSSMLVYIARPDYRLRKTHWDYFVFVDDVLLHTQCVSSAPHRLPSLFFSYVFCVLYNLNFIEIT